MNINKSTLNTKYKHIFFILHICMGMTSISHAKILTWKDNIPSSLSQFQNNPEQLAHLAQDKIVIYTLPATKTSLPTLKTDPNPIANFTTAAVVVPVSPSAVEKTIGNYAEYVGLYPTLKSAKILERSGNITQVKYKVSIPTPIPVLNFNEDVTFQHQLDKNSLASIVIDAPIPYGVGKIEWFRLAENKTLITLTQWGDLNHPKGFVFSKIMNAVPEAKLGIPSGTNTFILESLRKRFSANTKTTTLSAGEFPQVYLSPAQLEKVSQLSQNTQHPVSFVHLPSSVPYKHSNENLRFVTTYQYYSQSPQQLQKWTQPNAYKMLFPRQIKSIKTTALEHGSQDAEFKVSVGLGVINIPFHFKMNFNYPNATSNAFYANGGDLKYIKGTTEFNAHAKGTLLKMVTAMKIDEKAPFLIRAARSLPYHDVLPTVGGNVVFAEKIKAKN
ncbi:SRPBCC family protein [Acinetobacter shaoyimingii]